MQDSVIETSGKKTKEKSSKLSDDTKKIIEKTRKLKADSNVKNSIEYLTLQG